MKKYIYELFLSFFLIFIPFLLNGAEVDLNGFLTHSVEIKLPPGTNGLAPNLSLDYNSGAGNGIVGQGWSLNGLPAITRDTTNGIRYDGTDSYVGSSGRLKLQGDGSYHHEYENYSRVQRVGTAGDGPKYWVETKADGTKYYYGNYEEINTASVAALGKNGSIRAWALARVEDVHGNYYTVDYMQVDGEYYPKRIIYTQGNGISKLRVVDFEYGDRGDYWTQYIYSSAVTTKHRLTKIIVNIDVPVFLGWRLTFLGKKVQEYNVEYEGGSFGIDFSRVRSIEDYNNINGAIFKYSTIATGWVAGSSFPNFGNGDPSRYRYVDVNGDGKTDIIHLGSEGNQYVLLSTGTGWVAGSAFLNFGNGDPSRYQYGDVNGDGKTDIIHLGSEGNQYVLLSTGTGWVAGSAFLNFGNGDPSRYQYADVNGDGKTDIIHLGSEGNQYVLLSTGTGWVAGSAFLNFGNGDPSRYRYVDVNGDGKTDIIHIGSEGNQYLLLSTGTGWVAGSAFLNYGNGDPSRYQYVDVNGDGKTDIIHIGSEGNQYVLLSTGTGWVAGSAFLNYGNGDPSRYQYVDVNEDGKTDIIHIGSEGNQYVLLSTGTGWVAGSAFLNYGNGDPSRYRYVDINGDGRTDIIHIGSEGNQYCLINNNQSLRNIISIKNLLGNETSIIYKSYCSISGIIDPVNSIYPIIANSSPRELVTSITVNDGRGANYTKTYEYFHGKFHTGYPEERQNLYFEKTIETDTSTGIETTTYYDQRPWYAGSPISVVTKAGNQFLKIDDFTYDNTTGTGFENTHAVRLMNAVSTTYESGSPAITNTKSLSYDTLGNTTKITDTAGSSSITTSITYDTDANILNRPLEVTKTSGSKIIDSKKYTYSNNKIATMSAYLDTSGGYITTIYGTDECGNITSIKDPAGRTTTLEYDSDYSSFIAEVTNPLGHTVSMEYDAAIGKPISKTDQNGNTTQSKYDGAGRLVSVTNPYGDIVQEVDYHDELMGDANSQHIETRVYNDTVTGYTWSKSYVDGLGREYKKVSSAGTLESSPIVQVVDTTYDTAGRVKTKTIPYIENKQSKLYITYDYDSAGKIIKETRPENETDYISVTTSYTANSGGIKVTKIDPKGNESSALYDSRGRLVKKTEPEGAKVLYTYDEAGRLIRTVDAGNFVTAITYDSFGRKTFISDPNVGDISYSYDLSGNLLSKTDAARNTTNYSYDEINRLLKTDYTDDTPDVTYTYDDSSSANGKGRITSVETGVSSTKYAYDSNGNVEYLRQTVDNIDFIFTMEYNSQNQMTALMYPDGTRIENEYSETGYLKAVKQGDGAYVQYALKLNAEGKFKNTVRRITGNGVDTTIAYNPANMRPVAIESRNKNNELLEKNEYEYDLTGNITNITDSFDTKKCQVFVYDALNRVTKATGVYGEENYSYDPAGNLLKNSHGNLVYNDSAHPYAVTTDGAGNNYSYDTNGNMISGRGRDMEYDADGKLVSLKKYGVHIQKNTYDHAGHRVLLQKKDGTHIYNINGLYEMVKAPNRPDHHTKYIYGMKGDLAAQVTSSATLVNANFNRGFIYDKGYSGNPIVSLFAKGYIKADRYISEPKNILRLQYALILLLFLLLSGAVIRSFVVIRKSRLRRFVKPIWSSAVSLIVITAMTASLAFTGCEVAGPGRDDPVVTETGSIDDSVVKPGTVSGSGSETNTDTDTNTESTTTPVTGGHSTQSSSSTGLPVYGTFYFHPDHVGSISYLTDSAGNVVTRMSYTPYGEKVKSASSGPDIFHQKYTGQVDDDDEAELMYYNARYYDPKIGRFISADTMIPDAGFSQSFNRYMYVAGNPIKNNDPSGHKWGSGTWNKVVDVCTSDQVKNVGKGIVGGVTPYYAYKNGGWKGGALWFSGGALSYSRQEGYGITIGGVIPIPGTPFAISVGIHWQQKGFNEGCSVYGGLGYRKGNYMAGSFASYNFNTQNTTLGIYAGYSTKYGNATVGYGVTFNSNGHIIANGLMGSGSNYVLQQNFLQLKLEFEQTRGGFWSTNDLNRCKELREAWDVAMFEDEYATNEAVLQDATTNFNRQDPLTYGYDYTLSLTSNIPYVVSPLTLARGHWYW